jgi:cell volume regulation protein A
VFFTVLVSTLVQGTTLEPLARAMGLTSREPPLPRPLTEYGTIGRLGAEVMEYPVRSSDSIVGLRVRDLGLPHDATVNVIVRGDQAVAPRGSTHVEAGDTLHLLVRNEVAGGVRTLLERWRDQRLTSPEPDTGAQDLGPLLAEPWTAEHGDPGDPELVAGVPVVAMVQARRDAGGALVILEDGRAAVTGTSLVAGSAELLRRYAQRRLSSARDASDELWWREVIAALRR